MHAQLYCTPPSGGPSKSGPEPLVEPMVQNSTDVSMLSILHVNIRGWLSHHVELEAHIRLLPKVPMFVVVNETFLNASVEAVKLSGYDIICRRDRDDGRQGGGILVLASTPNALNVTLLKKSEVAERCWCLLHSDRGPLLLCCWYRPPNPGEVDTIISFISEYKQFDSQFIGTLIVGDLNVHHERWLKHSNGITPEGRCLFEFCCEHGFHECVKKPTRDNHLLDLVLTDLDESVVRTTVHPRISDHNIIDVSLQFSLAMCSANVREVWCYKDADWKRFDRALVAEDWSWMTDGDVDSVCERLTYIILNLAKRFIPMRNVACGNGVHP